MSQTPDSNQAFELLTKYINNTSLIKHALAVQSVMIHFAGLFEEEDTEKWGVIGLIHDLDYELYPDEHCSKTYEILKEENWPDEYIHAVMSHGFGICTDIEPTEKMEKVLYATDELTGLITAAVLMRPSRSLFDLEVSSIKKKLKQKSFAAGVDREIIKRGALMLSMDIEELIGETIKGMRKAADKLGLDGSTSE
jgi:predicted hydrolase (HD superfamily)